MSDNFMRVYNGIDVTPSDSDPTNPTEGAVFYASALHTGRAEGLYEYSSGDWVRLAGGGGGLDVFYDNDLESTGAADITAGQNPTFDNGGVPGGTLVDETSSPIAGKSSIKYTTHATPGSSDDDWFYLPTITLDNKQKGNDIGMSFYYTWDGSDDLIEVVIYDDTNNTVLSSSLDLIKTKSTATRFSTSVFIPTSCNAIKVGFHHTGVSESSKVLTFDDIELSTNPFVSKELIETQDIDGTGGGGTGVITNHTVTTTGANIFSGPASGIYTCIKACVLDVTHQANNSGASSGVDIYINGASATRHTSSSAVTQSVSWSGSMSPGDTFSLRGFTAIAGTSKFHAVAVAASEHIVTPAKSSLPETLNGTDFGETSNTLDKTASVTGTGLNAVITLKERCLAIINMEGSANINTNGQIQEIKVNGIQITRGVYGGPAPQVRGASCSYTAVLEIGDVVTYARTGTWITPHYTNATFIPVEPQFLAAVPVQKVAYIKDVKAAGGGGTFTSGAWRTRDLNTIEGDSSFVSLSANQFTLGEGQYSVEWKAPASDVQSHVTRLQNITDATTVARGSMTYDLGGGFPDVGTGISNGGTSIIITSSKTFELQHWCSFTKVGSGFGNGFYPDATDGMFSMIKITKLR